jgi:uncharacterized membrane protein
LKIKILQLFWLISLVLNAKNAFEVTIVHNFPLSNALATNFGQKNAKKKQTNE